MLACKEPVVCCVVSGEGLPQRNCTLWADLNVIFSWVHRIHPRQWLVQTRIAAQPSQNACRVFFHGLCPDDLQRLRTHEPLKHRKSSTADKPRNSGGDHVQSAWLAGAPRHVFAVRALSRFGAIPRTSQRIREPTDVRKAVEKLFFKSRAIVSLRGTPIVERRNESPNRISYHEHDLVESRQSVGGGR